MITKSNLDTLLNALQFQKDNMAGDVWGRTFPDGTDLKVNTATEKFLYKEAGITVTGATTANFAQNENFVVFECVCRLLEKGYKPKDIELEPAWKLGHTAKSGRADIWVRTKDKHGKVDSLLIIECKTEGKEFDGAWQDTLNDGAQLFSYFQQEGATKFLCLYSSDLADGKVTCKYHLINVRDNADYLKTLKAPKTFSHASTVKERFAAWHDTYKSEYARRGLFEEEIEPYKPGKNKYSTNDLREIDHDSMQTKYNDFATILRQHNVSGHENAFDKLVNLFLAKIVDEKLNPNDLRFYWKGIAYDDAFSLQDRLQYLYKVGMQEFLNEKVTYIDEATIKKAFKRFEKDPDATKDAIIDYFRQLKFYSNNDFSIIDVHNERLFNENAAILLKIVQMLEEIKLKSDKPNQFLGDLFEGFLDSGVKQSEGQFFTPLPIVRFIVSALPLKEMVEDAKEPLHVIDYACGAGHFLNEYARQVKDIVKAFYCGDEKKERSYYSSIVGVEKEYRLSKVAKVAAFMYGEDDIQIIYADALAKNPKVPEETFDALVANPPYSVKGFLETLSEEDRARYELNACVNLSSRSKFDGIQAFFVERAAQLLKPLGIAAIILPNTILTKGDNGNVFVKCREILLKNFDVIAISHFEKGSFSQTDTGTIVAFLRKKAAPPNFAVHWRNRVDAWFSGKHDGDEVFGDLYSLERYCIHRKFDFEEYKAFLDGTLSPTSALWDSDAFKMYRAAFKVKQPKFSEAEFIRQNEWERLYYFLLADANPVPVLVVKMPTETTAAKAFLGYGWSTKKGYEGIKYIGVADTSSDEESAALSRNKGIDSIKTPLFDNSNLFSADKLNTLIRSNFQGILADIPEQLQAFAKQVSLTDMLDFESLSFNKQMRTTTVNDITIKSEYPLVHLRDIAGEWLKGQPFKKDDLDKNGLTPCIHYGELFKYGPVIHEAVSKTNKTLVKASKKGDILFPCSDVTATGLARCSVILQAGVLLGGDVIIMRPKSDAGVDCKYLSIVINNQKEQLLRFVTGQNVKHLSAKNLERVVIPKPDISIQRQVVAECEKVDEKYKNSRMTAEEYREKIAAVLDRLKIVYRSNPEA